MQVDTFYSLLDPSSFYGGRKETVCSLLLTILPRPGHKYEKLSESLVPIDGEVNSITSISSFIVSTESSSKKVLLLKSIMKCLHKFGDFCYMEVNVLESILASFIYMFTRGPNSKHPGFKECVATK